MSTFREAREALWATAERMPAPPEGWEPIQFSQYEAAVYWLALVEVRGTDVTVRCIHPMPDGAIDIDFEKDGVNMFCLEVYPDRTEAHYFAASGVAQTQQILSAYPAPGEELLL